MSSSQTFDPSHAFILQNKEEMEIPLTLTQIPSAAAFESAISSLSEEQQRFAKAIRAMQLESSLFAVLLLQLKPALELLLHLPNDSLTKEIQLTQDLLELFIEFQIPSDLLTFDGPINATRSDKIEQVKGYVKNIQGMIEQAKKDKLEEAKKEAEFARAESLRDTYNEDDGEVYATYFSGDTQPIAAAAPRAIPKSLFKKARRVIDESGVGAALNAAGASAKTGSQSSSTTDSASSSSSSSSKAPGATASTTSSLDLTALPAELDKRFLAMDRDSALRSTKITLEKSWNKYIPSRYISRGSEGSSTAIYDKSMQERERNRAFDLIDALSRSGAIPLNASSLHIFIATTHAFDKSLISTVVQQNVNPIEKLDRSVMLIAHLIQGATIQELVQPNMLPNLIKFNPEIKQLMDIDASNLIAQSHMSAAETPSTVQGDEVLLEEGRGTEQ